MGRGCLGWRWAEVVAISMEISKVILRACL